MVYIFFFFFVRFLFTTQAEKKGLQPAVPPVIPPKSPRVLQELSPRKGFSPRKGQSPRKQVVKEEPKKGRDNNLVILFLTVNAESEEEDEEEEDEIVVIGGELEEEEEEGQQQQGQQDQQQQEEEEEEEEGAGVEEEEEEEGYYEEEEGYEEEEEGGGEEEGGEEEGYEEGGEEEEEGKDAKAVFAKCTYEYVAEKEGDLSLTVGDFVTLNPSQDFSGDWLYGAVGEGDPGYFPASYVQFVSMEEAFPEKKKNEKQREEEGEKLSSSSNPFLSESKSSQGGWRQERDTLKSKLTACEAEENRLKAEVAELERQRGEYLKEIAQQKYGSGLGKGGILYDIEKLYLGTYLETDSMSDAVEGSMELKKLLQDFAALVEKELAKEKDIGTERDNVLKMINEIIKKTSSELNSMALIGNTKDKFSDVLKKFLEKILAMEN